MAAYYVSTIGSDTTGNGSVGSPYRTITKGYSVSNPGDTIFVRGGTYAEKVWMNRSGSSGLPITITNYPSETPIVDGSTLSATGYYDSLITMVANYNTVDGITVRNFEYYDPTGGQYVGVSGPWWGGEGIQIYPYTTNNTIRNCTINHIGAFGIVAHGNNQLIEYNTLYDVGYPYAYYLPSLPSWGSVVSIQTQTGDTIGNIRSGTVCRYNTIYESIAEGIIFMRVRNGECYGNTVYDCTAPHLYFTNSDHITCYNNIVYATSVSWTLFSTRGPGRGIAVGNEYAYNPDGTSYLDIYNNLVYNTAHPFTYFIQPATQGFAQLANCNIVNNSFLDGNQSSGAYGNAATTVTFTTGNITNTTFRNNVISQTNASFAIFSASTLTGLTFSHNRWSKTPSGLTLDADSSVGDPLIARTGPTTSGALTGEYFRPQAGSPLLGAGTVLALVPTDYFGVTRSSPPAIGGLEGASSSDYEPTSAPWTVADVGATPSTGTDEYSSSLETYRQIGYGADMWGTADAFCFTYRQITGDFTFQYRVASIAGGGPYSKAGSDVRVALTAGSRHVSINRIPNNIIQRLIRLSDGGATSAANSSTTNQYQRVARSGDTLTTSHSIDGVTWSTVAVDDITGWGTTLYVGRAVCANDASASTTVLFDNVALSAYGDAVGSIEFSVDLAGVSSPTAIREATGAISLGIDLLGNTASEQIVDAVGTISVSVVLDGVSDPNIGDASDSTVFGNYKRALIGTAPQTVYGPVVAGVQASVVGCAISNRLSEIVKVSVALANGASTYYRAYNLPLQPNAVLQPFASGLRLDLTPGDRLIVSSDQENAVDSVVSYVERPS